jgi:hypothetical protein
MAWIQAPASSILTIAVILELFFSITLMRTFEARLFPLRLNRTGSDRSGAATVTGRSLIAAAVSLCAVKRGDRVAQLILERIYTPDVVVVEHELPATVRGAGGFGSTGLSTLATPSADPAPSTSSSSSSSSTGKKLKTEL